MRQTPLAAFLALLSACAAPTIGLQPRYADLSISGTAGASSGGTGGSADVEQAGLESDSTLGGRVDLEFGSPHWIALAQAPRFSGSGTLDVTVSDGTDTITAGAAVDSEVDLGMYELAVVFDLVPGETVELALGVGAAYLDLAFEFEEAGTGTTVDSDEALPIPLLAGNAGVWIGPVQLSVFAGGVSIVYEGDELTYVDADAFARWRFLGGEQRLRASIVLGYRWTDFTLEYDDDSTEIDADLTVQGPYVGLEATL